jgi:plasmid replication initiation protein
MSLVIGRTLDACGDADATGRRRNGRGVIARAIVAKYLNAGIAIGLRERRLSVANRAR